MSASIFIALAGLMGASGVVLLAASAHATPGAGLDSAGHMLLFHAVAALGGSAALPRGRVFRPLGTVALAGLVAGALLFSGDLALRAFAGHRLFPMAAPTGGVILIGSWVLLSVAAAITLARGS
jgi:uncharacterized membrane protein YgdD (TMEM256/DUF423 family)